MKYKDSMNELNTLFKVLEKIILNKLDNNKNAGMMVNRGKPDEVKMKYSDILIGLRKMRTTLSVHGSFTLGTCEDCSNFNQVGHNSLYDFIGECKGSPKTKYDCCHSFKPKGGWDEYEKTKQEKKN